MYYGEAGRLIVGVTGASGVVYAKRLLEVLKEKNIESHVIVSRAAEIIIKHELDMERADFEKLGRYCYREDEVDAPLASGSFKTDGMIIIPCSLKTLAGIASGYTDNLILRAADVTLKEKRKLVLVPRETPLNAIHLRNMLELARIGVVILPAMPAFYHKPKSINELVDFIVGKILDIFGIEHDLFRRWGAQLYE
ncbi:MAG: UbiX family flavin prenyltransferase [Thaumarchaeota archaeon]|jgi:flavin prenyltransferase|nr:UbiX family flavin prenyltransferase [Candidatus Geocrenenecus arthurdayi]MCL7402975.1 UbiX family flavin prenyltransferase [Candidatus Geocrenenecus arthurdayi]